MKVVIIEDEAPASRRLIKLIQEFDSSIEILTTIESVRSGIEWFRNNPAPDLIFSDIQLSDDLSFAIFKELEITTPIIFTTAYDEYAINAFKFYSIDYLLKPIKTEDLNISITKYKAIHEKPSHTDFNALFEKYKEKEYKSRFLVYSGDCLISLCCDDVAYLFSEEGAAFIFTFSGDRYYINDSLDLLEKQLDPKLFFRANRQYIVSIKSIYKIHPYFNQKLQLFIKPDKEKEVIISKLKASIFKQWLNK